MSPIAKIDWLLMEVEASAIYFAPRGQTKIDKERERRNGVTSCPAVLSKLSRTYTVDAPYDLHLRFTGTKERPEVRQVLSNSSITFEKLRKQFVWSPREQWITAEHPVFQITTPYVFASETSCFLNQAFPRDLIGRQTGFRLIEGRFPIHSWPRPLSWAVEWLAPEKDIIIKRGQPWFDLFFETDDPAAPVALRRQDMNEELRRRLLETKDVTSYIRGTSKLMGK